MNLLNYGIDAPGIVRNLFLFSLLAAIGIGVSFWIPAQPWFWIIFLFFALSFINLFTTGCGMLYSSLVKKPKIIRALVNKLQLQGNEILLDVGCGRGIVLIEAARRLPMGKAHGIDLWSQEDQSNNSLESTMHNIQSAKLTERIELHTGDMCKLPFPDGVFDVVVSSLAIHNITEEKERERALLEILRVLKPKGRFALLDIQHTKEYAIFINETKQAKASCSPKIYTYCPPIQGVFGNKF